MSAASRLTRHGLVVGFVLVVGGGAACSAVLGLGDYVIDKDLATSPETSTDGPAGEAGCDVDLTVQCYACPPATNEQILNSCTEGNCVPFEKGRLDGLLLQDGGLPPLPDEPPVPPIVDAGDDG